MRPLDETGVSEFAAAGVERGVMAARGGTGGARGRIWIKDDL